MVKPKNQKEMPMGCCKGGKFPTFAVLLLVIAVLWLLGDLGVITVDIPWIPIVLIVIAVGLILKHRAHKEM